MCCILSKALLIVWIFSTLDTAVQLKSAESKHNTISKYLIQDSFQHIFWEMKKMHHTFWKKATFRVKSNLFGFLVASDSKFNQKGF